MTTRRWAALGVLVGLAACAPHEPAASSASGAAGSAASPSGASAGAGGAAGTSEAGAGGASADDAGQSGSDGSDAAADGAPTPGAFMLTTPSTPLSAHVPKLEWTASEGAQTYDVEVSSSDTFDAASTKAKRGITDTFVYWMPPLEGGRLYRWRVTAVADAARTPAANGPRWLSMPLLLTPIPHGVAVTPDGKTLAVAHEDSPTALALTDLDTLETSFVSFQAIPREVAISPDGKTAFVSTYNGHGVQVVDIATHALTGTVQSVCAGTAYSIVVTPDGSSLVRPDGAAGCMDDAVDIVPLVGPSPRRQIALNSQSEPYAVALSGDGKSALATVHGLTRVDLASGAVTSIDVIAYAVASGGDGTTAWVSEGEKRAVRRVDLTTSTAGPAIAFEPNHETCGIAVTPDGKTGVVAGAAPIRDPGGIGVLDLETGAVTATYPVTARCVTVTRDGKRAYVTSFPDADNRTPGVYVIAL
jgi:DNA-binding beta-propeller fold protein YncE